MSPGIPRFHFVWSLGGSVIVMRKILCIKGKGNSEIPQSLLLYIKSLNEGQNGVNFFLLHSLFGGFTVFF